MQSEFEEKTYEQYLTAALVSGSNAFFAPGQVLEHIVGFDAAIPAEGEKADVAGSIGLMGHETRGRMAS